MQDKYYIQCVLSLRLPTLWAEVITFNLIKRGKFPQIRQFAEVTQLGKNRSELDPIFFPIYL